MNPEELRIQTQRRKDWNEACRQVRLAEESGDAGRIAQSWGDNLERLYGLNLETVRGWCDVYGLPDSNVLDTARRIGEAVEGFRLDTAREDTPNAAAASKAEEIGQRLIMLGLDVFGISIQDLKLKEILPEVEIDCPKQRDGWDWVSEKSSPPIDVVLSFLWRNMSNLGDALLGASERLREQGTGRKATARPRRELVKRLGSIYNELMSAQYAADTWQNECDRTRAPGEDSYSLASDLGNNRADFVQNIIGYFQDRQTSIMHKPLPPEASSNDAEIKRILGARFTPSFPDSK
jgi:hypothetical protein